MAEKRIEYYDFLRGIAILFVIGIHAFWAYQDKLIENGLNITDWNLWIRQTIGCCVPMFLALSGFFLASKDLSTPKKYFSFLGKHVKRVYIPCLIFSIPFLVWGIMKSQGMDSGAIQLCMKRWLTSKNGGIGANLFYYLVCGEAVYYFVAVIIQFYILLPVMQRLADKKGKGLIISFLISLAATIVLGYIAYIMKVNLALIIYGGLFPFWVLYYVLGVYYGKGYRIKIPCKWLVVAAAILLAVMCWETWYMVEVNGYHLPSSMGNRKFSWIPYCFVCLVLMFEGAGHYKSNAVTRFFAKAGDYSFGIYLIHLFFLLFVVKPLIPGLHWTLETILSFLLSTGFIWLCRRINEPFVKKYLGF